MRNLLIILLTFFIQSQAFSASSIEDEYEDELAKLSQIDYAKSVNEKGSTFVAPDGFKLKLRSCDDTDFECIYLQARVIISAPYAYKGSYGAQRELASCLNDGCSKSIVQNVNLACAWRTVILASGSAEIDETDDWLFEGCYKKLTPSGQSTAKVRAIKMFPLIYGRQIDRDWR